MRILKVSIFNPHRGQKGDEKLIVNRSVFLEEKGCIVDYLYFRVDGLFNVARVDTHAVGVGRRGINIVISVGLVRILLGCIRRVDIITHPFQTWLSYGLSKSCKSRLETILRCYRYVHYYHIRCLGLFEKRSSRCLSIIDLIDSYTLNLESGLRFEENWLKRLLLSEELRRIKRVEQNVDGWWQPTDRCVVLVVSSVDAAYLAASKIRTEVVPVGIALEESGERQQKNSTEVLECIFFGNLNYEPNRLASMIVGEVKAQIDEREELGISFTVAGRNADKGLRTELANRKVRLISPVDDMRTLVESKDIAIFPMMTGSGMQSKVLEAIAWGCVVVSTNKAARPIGLRAGVDYVECNSIKSFSDALMDIKSGRYDLASLRRNAREKIESLEWGSTVDSLLKIYEANGLESEI